jgi:cyclase
VIACGGAGERADLAEAIKVGGASAVAAGSIFVYQGRERGVLINFPERGQLEALLA